MDEITIWCNNSKEAKQLLTLLKLKFDKVTHILTSSDLPSLRYNDNYIVGQGQIIYQLGLHEITEKDVKKLIRIKKLKRINNVD